MMFKHILVPLDGSSLAEDVLGPVESFALHLGARVTLLHVVEREAPKRVHGESHLGDVAEASAYLERIALSLAEAGIQVETHVHERSVADVPAAIDTHAHEYDADLIAMCKHGRSGIRQRLVGSIAQHILRGGGTPMLLRTPRSSGDRDAFELKELLVPIDFEHNTEAVLDIASGLARPYGARLSILTAVASAAEGAESAVARLLPGAAAAALDMAHEDAAQRLAVETRRLEEGGTDVRSVLRPEEPATAILREAAEIGADVVVLATHARSGFEAWYEGSTGESVITRGEHTLLLLREL